MAWLLLGFGRKSSLMRAESSAVIVCGRDDLASRSDVSLGGVRLDKT
jgi:hypothetical protein